MPALFSVGCAKSGPNADLGLQIYSLRNQLKEDFEGTLKKVAEIGYKNIEAYGLGADGKYLKKVAPAEYKKICNDLGMNLVSTHGGYCEVEQAQVYIDAALESGLEYLIVPYLQDKIRQALSESGGDINEAAKVLGLKEQELKRKMKKLGME